MKKVFKWVAIAAAVVVVLLALTILFNLLGGRWISASKIQKCEFQGFNSCEGPISKTVEITDGEAWMAATDFNLAIYAGGVAADACDSEFNFTFYLEDGTRISVTEADSPRVKVYATGKNGYWVISPSLAAYAQYLIEKYDLTVS